MHWLRENRNWLLFAVTVLSGLGAVGVAVVGLFTTLSVLLTGGPILGIVAGTVFGSLALFGLCVVFGVRLVTSLAASASLPKSQRVADGLGRLERFVPPLSALGLADRFEPPEPTVEERREALTQRYVDGELSEAELEARLRTLLDEEDDERDTPSARAVADERAVAEAGRDGRDRGTDRGERERETEER
ncbi:hypothetical protein ACFQL1_14115 [Halomicroarcula sp. GCM10025709]|uniref:hypothetical protein n=1 Tax=Haloarcula TaxID=2237 RepID=UPI0024C3F776|nr:hypothetical protein [Halomicroarcula sp. YJ-61-S]